MSDLTPFLDSDFNPLIPESFLYGIYTLLFVQALWELLKRQAHVLYICAFVLLWMSITSSYTITWVYTRIPFVVANASPTSVLEAVNGSPVAMYFVPDFVGSVISQSILIWRCYVLWDNTWSLMILIPLLFLSSGFNLYSCVTLVANGSTTGILYTGLALLFSAATTVSATVMIALKIIIVTRRSQARYSYTRIIDILVQSAALESSTMVVAFVAAITEYELFTSNPSNGSLDLWFLQLSSYTSAFRIVVVGIAPTLIAFRVTHEKPSTELDATRHTNPLSRLTFRRSACPTDTLANSMDNELPPLGETERIQDKEMDSV